MTRRRAIACLALSTLAALSGSAGVTDPSRLQRFAFTEPHMGTLFQIVLFAPDAESARTAAVAAYARVATLNRIFSDYDAASELSRLTAAVVGRPVKVSPELFDLLARSQALAAQTGGAFDITLGPMIRQWREARRTGRLPDAAAREAARRASGHALLHLDPVTSTVVLARAGMKLDLGGIAKGYAADAALAVIRQHGFTHAMVAASGDLALGDAPPGKRGWTVELAPFGREGGTAGTVIVANAAVSTSGDSEQGVEIGGVRYSHIVDPATGLGLTQPRAVTVVAQEATLSDALATACSVAAPEAIGRLIAGLPAAVRILVSERGPDGAIERTLYGRDPDGLVSFP